MDTYYQLSDEKKREMYLQVEPLLTISDFKSVETNLKKMDEKYQSLESKLNNLLENFNSDLTEVQNMNNHNMFRIFDCGNFKFEYTV